jgi:L-ascorbate metabolism protein UlaG (beta-lactamase superfamily)
MNGVLNISYLGHSCFLLESEKGFKILTDPFDKSIGYNTEPVFCDVVTVSHEHFDHANLRMGLGNPRVFKGVNQGNWVGIDTTMKGVRIFTVSVYHDEENGRLRGKNAIFVFEFHDSSIPLRVCHLGDLGHDLKPEDITRIGKVDILFVPIGGYFTIDPVSAHKVVTKISPKIVIPMHYRTEVTKDWNIAEVGDFVKLFNDVIFVDNWSFTLQPANLENVNVVYVMNYRK